MGGCWGSNKPKAWPGPLVVREVSRLGLSVPSNAAGVTPCCSFFRWSWQAGECYFIPLQFDPVGPNGTKDAAMVRPSFLVLCGHEPAGRKEQNLFERTFPLLSLIGTACWLPM